MPVIQHQRHDVLPLRLSPPKVTPEGVRVYDAVLARAGVFQYADGAEYTPPSVLAAALDTAAAKTVTAREHPGGMVTLDTLDKFRVGTTDTAPRFIADGEDSFITGKLIVDSTEGTDAVDEGSTEISPGYLVEGVKEDGVSPAGIPYNFRRTAIHFNHFAVLDAGRQNEDGTGPRVGIRADAGRHIAPRQDDAPMKIRIDGKEYTDATEAALAVRSLEDSAKAEKARADQAVAEKSEAEGALAAEKARADKAEADLKARTDGIDAERNDWLKAHEAIKPVADSFKVAIRTDAGDLRPHDEVRRDIVAAELGDDWKDAEKHDASEVKGAFASIQARADRAAESIDRTYNTQPKTDGARVTLDDANAGFLSTLGKRASA